MPWGVAIVVGAIIGTLSGFATERVELRPIVRSAGSATLSPLLGMIGMLVVWYSRPEGFGSGFLAIGLGLDNLLWLGLFLGAVLAFHFVLGLAHEPVRNHRPVILGAVGGVCGALSVAWLMVVAASSR